MEIEQEELTEDGGSADIRFRTGNHIEVPSVDDAELKEFAASFASEQQKGPPALGVIGEGSTSSPESESSEEVRVNTEQVVEVPVPEPEPEITELPPSGVNSELILAAVQKALSKVGVIDPYLIHSAVERALESLAPKLMEEVARQVAADIEAELNKNKES